LKVLPLGLAVVFFVVAALYLFGILSIGASPAHHHVKHAALFAILGVLSLVWMRFAGKPAAVGSR
jgi:hypothetical protein